MPGGLLCSSCGRRLPLPLNAERSIQEVGGPSVWREPGIWTEKKHADPRQFCTIQKSEEGALTLQAIESQAVDTSLLACVSVRVTLASVARKNF